MFKTSATYKGRYDLGLTAVHEAGHWFGLEHTFYGGCNTTATTSTTRPPRRSRRAAARRTARKDTCPRDAGLDPIHNYMDYSYDACYTEFTQGQAARSRDHWLEFRA